MEKVRAKFTCTKAVKTEYGTELSMWALYSDNPEDNTYSKYTPSGQITMIVDNPSAEEFFKPGEKYYLDFTKV